MKWKRRIQLQARNVFVMNASDLTAFLHRCVWFPVDYYLRGGRCSFPSNITLFITFRCNLRCQMCFFKENLLRRKHDELTYEEVIKFLDEVAPRRPGLFITGGEPFIRGDLPDIIAHAKSKRVRVGINTNGTLLTREKIAHLLVDPPDYIIFSIEGSEEIHNEVRGAGNYRKVLDNLRFLADRPREERPRIFINAVISETSVQSLDRLVDLAADLDLDALWLQQLTFLTPRDICAHNEFCRVYFPAHETDVYFERNVDGPEQGVMIRKKLSEAKIRAEERGLPFFMTPDLVDPGIEAWYRDEWSFTGSCMTPWNSTMITPSGDVIPCPVSHFIHMGNITETSFENIWNGHEYIRFRNLLRQKKAFPGCNRCCKA